VPSEGTQPRRRQGAWAPLLVFTLLAATAAPAAAECDDKRPFDDPCPVPQADQTKDELHLPLSDDVTIVFRKVRVPGDEYWFNPSRTKTFGDADADDIFETKVELQIFGSFPEGDNWYYLLGKYELTKAQAAIALGDGDMNKGLQELAVLSDGRDEDDVALAERAASNKPLPPKTLAQPVRYLDWFSVERLLQALNQRCFNYPPCAAKLPFADPEEQRNAGSGQPRADAARAFMRLPTELEWEYAARGGMVLVDDPRFNDVRPFEEAELGDYAYIDEQGPTRVGRRAPVPGGLYDLFGNVKEYVADQFKTGILEGRPGARMARGPSFGENTPADVRSSRREEVPLYRFVEEGGELKVEPLRSPTVGLRLALGSKSLDGSAHRRRLEEQYEEENPGLTTGGATGSSRSGGTLSPTQRSRLAPAAMTVEPLQEIRKLLEQASFPNTQTADDVERELGEVERLISRQLDDLRKRYTDIALKDIVEFGNITIRVLGLEGAVAQLEALEKKGLLNTANQRALRDYREALQLQVDQQVETGRLVYDSLGSLKDLGLSDPTAVEEVVQTVSIRPGRDGALKQLAQSIALDYLSKNMGLRALYARMNKDFRDCNKTMTDPRLCQ